MEAGLLRHRVELQRKQETQDPNTGAISEEWATDRTVWAWVQPLSTREFLSAGESIGTLSARITIRYMEGIDETWRVLHRGKVYDVQGVMADKDSGLEYLTLQVSGGVHG